MWASVHTSGGSLLFTHPMRACLGVILAASSSSSSIIGKEIWYFKISVHIKPKMSFRLPFKMSLASERKKMKKQSQSSMDTNPKGEDNGRKRKRALDDSLNFNRIEWRWRMKCLCFHKVPRISQFSYAFTKWLLTLQIDKYVMLNFFQALCQQHVNSKCQYQTQPIIARFLGVQAPPGPGWRGRPPRKVMGPK